MSRHHPITSNSDPSLNSRPRSTSEVIRRVAPYIKPYRWMALANIVCALMSLAFAFAYPKLTQQIIDVVIAQNRRDLLAWVIGGLIGAFLLRELFNGLRIRINNRFEQNVIFDIRRDLYARLQRLPVGYFDQRSSGDLMTRVIEDVNSVERVLIDGTEQGTVALLSIVGVLFILFQAHASLAWMALIPMPFLIGGALWYTLTAHERYRAQRKASSAMNALLMDNLQGIRQIKAFGRHRHEDERFSSKADDLRQGTLKVMMAWAAYSPAMAFASSLGIGCVLYAGGGLVMDGQMKIGELVQFLLYLGLFYEPVGRLHQLNQMIQSARAAGERVFDIFDATPERPDRTGTLPETIRGEIRYEGVEFAYQADRPTLKSVTVHARPGEMVALVGPTGAGKSTFVNLLPAFYEATAGKITIDGHDTRGTSLESLRRVISVVSQEPFLFNGTVRENILYGKLDASDAELVEAAKAANCHDFISNLPDGYESRVGERGVKLSVGEKQRVSIARALLKNAPILILDEATASVDTATERLIQEALTRLMRGRTTFVIAHRLSTIREADQILV
ncbi:MAG: ABC transporter ATP-binding protein, partial [Verrucomicrobia bacterium]|nr:ABC transporter ATP-binding protein [Verrucomicrobiota bacterium]